MVAASMVFLSGYVKNFGSQSDDPQMELMGNAIPIAQGFGRHRRGQKEVYGVGLVVDDSVKRSAAT